MIAPNLVTSRDPAFRDEANPYYKPQVRLRSGEHNPNSKLAEADVREMRELREDGMSYALLAHLYGVRYDAARSICLRHTWKHIP